jgi:hypothetical protein
MCSEKTPPLESPNLHDQPQSQGLAGSGSNEGAKVGQPEAPAAVHPTPTAKRADTDSSLVQGAGPAEQLRDADHNQVRQRPERRRLRSIWLSVRLR